MSKEKLSQEIAKMIPELREKLSLSEYLELMESTEEVENIEEFTERVKAKNYSPSQPRDDGGKWSGGSGSAIMSESQAKEATKNSKYQEVLYHGTSGDGASNISKEGFDASKSKRNLHGEGVYLTPEYYDARSYAFAEKSYDNDNPQQMIKSYVDVENPYYSNSGSGDNKDLAHLTNKALNVNGYKTDSMGYPSDEKEFNAWQKEFSNQANKILETHDALIISQTGTDGGQPVVIVRDTSKIKIFSIEDVNAEMRRM